MQTQSKRLRASCSASCWEFASLPARNRSGRFLRCRTPGTRFAQLRTSVAGRPAQRPVRRCAGVMSCKRASNWKQDVEQAHTLSDGGDERGRLQRRLWRRTLRLPPVTEWAFACAGGRGEANGIQVDLMTVEEDGRLRFSARGMVKRPGQLRALASPMRRKHCRAPRQRANAASAPRSAPSHRCSSRKCPRPPSA